jgi:amino acid adenylation domain-containing protein
LWDGFLKSAAKFPEHIAVMAEGKTLSYRELRSLACRIAATIQAHPERMITPLTAVFAYRSTTAYAGVLGALLSGNGYVPLNRTFPQARTREMFERSGARSLIVDEGSLQQLPALLDSAHENILVICADLVDCQDLRARWPQHIFVAHDDLLPSHDWIPPTAHADSVAYLLFTSGSTGRPKGVVVAQRNVIAFLDYILDRYQIHETDRLSQMFDMTFDLSVFDMFVAWERGARICCPSQKELIKPGKFIQEQDLTIWFSVPSTVVFMKQLGMLKPGRYPSLRFSLFCGEPLPAGSLQSWSEAAPNSILENLYGPTELTIACTLYRWNPAISQKESESGIVPIGSPFPGMDFLVVDEQLHEVSPGSPGELLMKGPQMSLGYWKDLEKTAAAFVVPPGHSEVFYRTGDRVRRPAHAAPLIHMGRIDSQIKVLGHRVELGEIEAVVRTCSELDGVVAVGWPPVDGGFGGVEIFLEAPAGERDLRPAVQAQLPEYMVPRRFHFMKTLPRNANNKYDRGKLNQLLREGL